MHCVRLHWNRFITLLRSESTKIVATELSWISSYPKQVSHFHENTITTFKAKSSKNIIQSNIKVFWPLDDFHSDFRDKVILHHQKCWYRFVFRPIKRSGTPDHLLNETGVEMRNMSRSQPPPGQVSSSHRPGGQAPVVSSPGRQSLQSQYTPASQYSQGASPGTVYSQANSRSYAPSTTYNPGYQDRRYLSEGELLGEGSGQVPGVGPSTSAGQLQVIIFY